MNDELIKISNDKAVIYITKNDIKNMLRKENELRLSAEYQQKFREAEESGTYDWMNIVEKLQYNLVKEYGFIDWQTDVVLNILRRAQYLFPNDQDFKTIPLYVKYNRAGDSKLNEGDTVPDIKIYDSDLVQTFLTTNMKPLVVLTGSYT